MARERQQAINADHPLVQEFWEAFDYLDGLPVNTVGGPKESQRLNHSRDSDLIAVNLNEFVEMAATHRQQVPVLAELKKVLRTSSTTIWLPCAASKAASLSSSARACAAESVAVRSVTRACSAGTGCSGCASASPAAHRAASASSARQR